MGLQGTQKGLEPPLRVFNAKVKAISSSLSHLLCCEGAQPVCPVWLSWAQGKVSLQLPGQAGQTGDAPSDMGFLHIQPWKYCPCQGPWRAQQ